MITLLLSFAAIIAFTLIVGVLMGLLALSPIVIFFILLPLIDYFILKIIFGKKKK